MVQLTNRRLPGFSLLQCGGVVAVLLIFLNGALSAEDATVVQKTNSGDREAKSVAAADNKDTKSTTVTTTEAKKVKSVIVVDSEKIQSPQTWNSWTPVSENSSFWLPPPNTTPLTVPWQEAPRPNHAVHHNHYSKPSHYDKQPSHYDKHANPPPKKKRGSEEFSMAGLRNRAMNYGKTLLGLMSGTKGVDYLLGSASESEAWSGGGAEHGSEGSSSGGGGHERSALGWLTRLIGVEGKSLGEFLREYQVHVLYDLAFTFFKWIFFLYAGLLIP